MPLTRKELAAKEAKRNLGAELLQAVQEMKEGRTGRIKSECLLPVHFNSISEVPVITHQRSNCQPTPVRPRE